MTPWKRHGHRNFRKIDTGRDIAGACSNRGFCGPLSQVQKERERVSGWVGQLQVQLLFRTPS